MVFVSRLVTSLHCFFFVDSPVLSKRGYLHVMDDCSCRWNKCYVVSGKLSKSG